MMSKAPYQLLDNYLLIELACRADKMLSVCAVLVRQIDEKMPLLRCGNRLVFN